MYAVPTIPVVIGDVDVIVGSDACGAMTRVKFLGLVGPVAFDAVIARIVVPAAFGVPSRTPVVE